MLKDYVEYIENIRNNLIQNNIDVPAYELETYRDVFNYSLILEQVCWFYQQLLWINADCAVRSKYIYPDEYKDRVRKKAYRSFLHSLDTYRKLSTNYYVLEKLKKEEEELDRLLGSDDIDALEGIDEDDDLSNFLFGDGSVGGKKEEEVATSTEKVSGTFLDFVQTSGNTDSNVVYSNQSSGASDVAERSIVHGLFIDEYVKGVSDNEEKSDEGTQNTTVVHGVYIDEWEKLNSEKETVTKTAESSGDGINHGVFIDEWQPNEEISIVASETEERDSWGININEVHGVYIDEWQPPVSVSRAEPDDEIHGLFIDEWSGFEEEEVESEPDEVDDFFEESEDDDTFGGGYVESPAMDIQETIPSTPVESPKPVRDISDTVQDSVNKLLTQGKRFLMKR